MGSSSKRTLHEVRQHEGGTGQVWQLQFKHQQQQ